MHLSTYDKDAYTPPPVDLPEALHPLLQQLRRYDHLRRKLEQEGGSLDDVNRLTHLLNESLPLKGRYQRFEAALTQPTEIRAFLRDVGLYRLHLQVRKRENGLPAYYLCRVRRSYWDEYALVVEDLYQSPGYPVRDARFVQLMYLSKETYHLCLSPFRAQTQALLTRYEETTGSAYPGPYAAGYAYVEAWTDESMRPADRLLFDVGRHVLQAAWHEDQRIGVLAATCFDVPRLQEAIELLYLCLSGELFELRSVVTEPMCRFFEQAYPQPAIAPFLRGLPYRDGNALNALTEDRARALYRSLMAAFKRFLNVEVAWGRRGSEQPLYKLLFANVARMERLADDLRPQAPVRAAAAELETSAQRIIEEVTHHT